MKKVFVTALLASAVALPSAANAAVFFNSTSLSVADTAYAYNPNAQNQQNGYGSDGSATNPGTMDAFAAATAIVNRASASAIDSVTSTFAGDNASGTFDATSESSVKITAGFQPGAQAYAYGGGYSYIYYFAVDTLSNLTLNYLTNQIGPSVNGAVANLYSFSSSSYLFNNGIGSAAGGAYTAALNPGSYYLQIYSPTYATYLSQYNAVGSQSASLVDHYDFTIDAVSNVPEPSTWAMMLAGFGAVGFSMRRRRNVRVSFA